MYNFAPLKELYWHNVSVCFFAEFDIKLIGVGIVF